MVFALASIEGANTAFTESVAKAEVPLNETTEWQTITFDYKVDDNVIQTADATFGYYLQMKAKSGKLTFYIDDIKVELVGTEGKERRLDMYSLDGAASAEETSYIQYTPKVETVNVIDGNLIAIEATASAASEGDVISIVDGETYSLVKAVDGKLMFGDTVLCNDKGEEIVLGEEPTKVVAIYDDNAGTVRFVVGDSLAYYKDCETAKVTYELPAIEGGVSDGATIGTEVDNVSIINHTIPNIVGCQKNDEQTAIRFISGVDSVYYSSIGFKLETENNVNERDTTKVYSAVVSGEDYFYASDCGYKYISAISITDIANIADGGQKIKVTPYLLVGENYIYGETVYYNVTGADGNLDIDEVSEAEFGE